MNRISECHECGSIAITWHCGQRIISSVQNGRLNTSDVAAEFYLGCDECSETLQVVTGDQVADWLNQKKEQDQ